MIQVDSPSPSSKDIYLRLLSYVRPYWRVFLVGIIGMIVSAAAEPLFPALMRPLLDGKYDAASLDSDSIWFYPVALMGIFLIRGLIVFVTNYAMAWVSNRVVMDIRMAMFRRLVNLPTPFFDDRSSGVLMSKLVFDVGGVSAAATSVLTIMVRDSLTLLALFSWMFWLNWKLSLIALAVAPLIALSVRGVSGRQRSLARGSQQVMGELTHILEESIEGHKVVKIFGGQNYEIKRFEQINLEQRGNAMRLTVAAGLATPAVQLLASVALGIVIFITLWQVARGETTMGSFVSFMTAMLMLLAPMKRLTDVSGALQRGLASAESVFELLDEPAEPDNGTLRLERVRGDLEFVDVSFAYSGANRGALERVSLSIRAGEMIALVGASGSGKTTLANLVPRFYQADSGKILLDGIDIYDLNLECLRNNVALVSQDVVLFNDTVAANITYGAMDGQIGKPEIEAAARAAYAHDFILAMPNGYDTLVGENGVKLSGGQRQRLAIARALLKNTPLLILDEATSALDTESERQVQAALETLMQGRTTLVIAHRLSTIERANRIVVMRHGHVAEIGTHAELVARDGIYARLHRLQYEREEVEK